MLICRKISLPRFLSTLTKIGDNISSHQSHLSACLQNRIMQRTKFNTCVNKFSTIEGPKTTNQSYWNTVQLLIAFNFCTWYLASRTEHVVHEQISLLVSVGVFQRRWRVVGEDIFNEIGIEQLNRRQMPLLFAASRFIFCRSLPCSIACFCFVSLRLVWQWWARMSFGSSGEAHRPTES